MSYDDALGDKLVMFEKVQTAQNVAADEWVMVRVDGRAFSNFTGSFEKPYDLGIAEAMKETAKGLMNDLSAHIAYTQSDEITLLFKPGKIPFDARLQKIASVCAGKASALFVVAMMRTSPEIVEKQVPCFDGRAIGVTEEIASKFIMWRELDGRRNALLTTGQAEFGHDKLRSKSPGEVKDMLRDVGIDYDEDYPAHFLRGTLIRKRKVEMPMTDEELAKVPEKHREAKRGMTFMRSRIVEMEDHPPLYLIENLESFLLYDAEPIIMNRSFARHVTP